MRRPQNFAKSPLQICPMQCQSNQNFVAFSEYMNFNLKKMQNSSKINHNRKLSMALELFSIEMQFHKSIFPDLYSFCKSIRSSKVSLIWNRIFFLDAALRERIIIKKKQTDILNLTDNRFFYKQTSRCTVKMYYSTPPLSVKISTIPNFFLLGCTDFKNVFF